MPGAARLGDNAQVDSDAHGCPACPHPGVGPIVVGSADVFTNGNKPNPIAVVSFPTDSRDCQRVTRSDAEDINKGSFYPSTAAAFSTASGNTAGPLRRPRLVTVETIKRLFPKTPYEGE